MSEYFATIVWERNQQNFLDNKYSRNHRWDFEGGTSVPASASPSIVPEPMSTPANVDPEEAFVASLSSCHMLFFLAFAAKQHYIVDNYTDKASGVLEKDAEGKLAMTKITLHPKVTFSAEAQPDHEQLEELHHRAHEHCFIANSVKAQVEVEIS